MGASFHNDDTALRQKVEEVMSLRHRFGLEGLVGGLCAVVINTAPEDFLPAAGELLGGTALRFEAMVEDPLSGPGASCLLLRDGFGADFLLKTRQGGDNPFAPYNLGAKTGPDSAARLETFVFACNDLERYVAIQKTRGVRFLTDVPIENAAFSCIQTGPSPYTGNSLGFIEWKGRPGAYVAAANPGCGCVPAKPDRPWLSRIGGLDHVATRVRARQRDAAIVEFLGLTGYHFEFAVYVESLNSITSVARLGSGDYAQVFTSGIAPGDVSQDAGPTERFIDNYGVRPHHMAFSTVGIEDVVSGLAADGWQFLCRLAGSREEGLKQIFSAMSPRTFLVNEYIERYDGFDGFFTKSNVTHLTKATENQ